MARTATRKSTRTRQAPEQRTKDILNHAETVFDERGFEKATVADIAKRAGVVEGTVFRYFANKHELLLQISNRWYSALFDELNEGLKGITGCRNRLRYLIWNQLNAVNERTELTGAIILAARGQDKNFTEAVNAQYARFTAPFFDIIEQGMKLGEIRNSVQPLLIAQLVYGGIEQYLWRKHIDGQDIPVDTIADEMVELIFGGIAQPAPAKTNRGDELLDRLEALLDKK